MRYEKNFFEMDQKRENTSIRIKLMTYRFLIHVEAIEFAVFDPLYILLKFNFASLSQNSQNV